uniref:Uncharacterized protein n=1 Tax=Myoviridae sp. ctbEa13 TaxID=2825136 RepID=A0A8S5VB98_9CAUD|nr:MAG TPA: hypothetical protein [Myoviridae sp. ctbEa13]
MRLNLLRAYNKLYVSILQNLRQNISYGGKYENETA